MPGRQHPIFKASDLEDNFAVALDRGGAKSATGLAAMGSSPELKDVLADRTVRVRRIRRYGRALAATCRDFA